MEDEVLQLGGNIELSGFSNLDGGRMIVLKKIVGQYARRMTDKANNFEKLVVTMKTVHDNQFEIKSALRKPSEHTTTEQIVDDFECS